MKIIASAAISLDGYLDDTTPERLMLSSPEDWEEVRTERALCDAILVGAETVRRDNPSLTTSNPLAREERLKRGQYADPIKITVSVSGDLNTESNFFQKGQSPKIVFVGQETNPEKIATLEQVAEVIVLPLISAKNICDVLQGRGINRLMVEGGSTILTMFFQENCIDEFRLAMAPFFVGDDGPRLVKKGVYPWNKNKRMQLKEVKKLGDMAVMYYTLV